MPHYITILLLLCIIFLLCLCTYTFIQNTKRHLFLKKTKKGETDQKLKKKEEQSLHTQTENAKILADLQLKEIELEGKKMKIEQLKIDIKTFDHQIKAYTQKIDDFELNHEKQQEQLKDEKSYSLMIINDVIKLITKKLPGKEEYIELLKHIDGQFIYTLKHIYDGNLSIPYIKYCICFAIGMKIEEVSECFSIEQSSVHMVRYRLKKKFGLNNHEDFDVFLRLMN